MRRVNNHPNANSRGYVQEHRLIMEKKLGRFLIPRKELVHHIDGNRSNNNIENLKLTTPKEHAYKDHEKARNKNGQFVANEPIFNEIKYRLYDNDKNLTQVYTLQELISKTFRRAKFKYRGVFTGLKDKNGVEIYEGDVIPSNYTTFSKGELKVQVVRFLDGGFRRLSVYQEWGPYGAYGETKIADWHDHGCLSKDTAMETEVLGNIYENPELLEEAE